MMQVLPSCALPMTKGLRSSTALRVRLRSSMSVTSALPATNRRSSYAGITAANNHEHTLLIRPMCRVMSCAPISSRRKRAKALADNTETYDPNTRAGGYPFQDIESKWQRFWLENKTFRTPDQVDTNKPKFYALDMFPYPRFVDLHVLTLLSTVLPDFDSSLLHSCSPFSNQWRWSSCRASRGLYCNGYHSSIQTHYWAQCSPSHWLGCIRPAR